MVEGRHLIGVRRHDRDRGHDRDDCHDCPAPQPPKRLGCGEHGRNRRLLVGLTWRPYVPKAECVEERERSRQVSSCAWR